MASELEPWTVVVLIALEHSAVRWQVTWSAIAQIHNKEIKWSTHKKKIIINEIYPQRFIRVAKLSWAERCERWRCCPDERCWQPDASSSYCQSYSPKAPQAATAAAAAATATRLVCTPRLVNGCAKKKMKKDKKHVHFHWVKVVQREQRGWLGWHNPHAASSGHNCHGIVPHVAGGGAAAAVKWLSWWWLPPWPLTATKDPQ